MLIRAKEAAKMLNVRLPRLYELARTGAIPMVRLGPKSVRFSKAALEEWIANGGNQSTPFGVAVRGSKETVHASADSVQ